jgi:ArsR family transcriptional regulator
MQIAKALADANRVRILVFLAQSELCLCQIIEMLGLAPSTVSKHLSILRQAGLVEDNKSGKWVYYSLSRENVNPFNQTALALFRSWLNDDKRVVADRVRLDHVLRMPLEEVCKR